MFSFARLELSLIISASIVPAIDPQKLYQRIIRLWRAGYKLHQRRSGNATDRFAPWRLCVKPLPANQDSFGENIHFTQRRKDAKTSLDQNQIDSI
jgi:hypothetical protein